MQTSQDNEAAPQLSVVKMGSEEGYLDELEVKAAELYFAKIITFSRVTGSTTNSNIGKSWPQSSQVGIVAKMKRWQKARHFRFRSDLLSHWATLLEKEGKIEMIVKDPKRSCRNILKPIPGKVEGSDSESHSASGRISDEEGGDESKERSESEDKEENDHNTQESEAKENKKRKRRSSSTINSTTKKTKRTEELPAATTATTTTSTITATTSTTPNRTPNRKAAPTISSKLHRDKERFYQMINGLRECDQILNAMWLQSQEDEQTIANLTKKISQFATKREEDQNIINSLREENTQLRIKMFQMVAQFQQLQEKQDQKLVQPTDTKVQAQHHLQQALDQLLQVLGAQELTENAQPVPENMQEEKTESQIESVASTLSNKF